ncbi:hypothetical protein VTK73DRAFT_5182 [Phialemonium thermophilum]|uniref:Mitochondrial seryl-tRNA synthetase n=1 Tax=Phialemonium thermophilum TaxID=223376 RepID=A0ABR3WPK1_9PEZI
MVAPRLLSLVRLKLRHPISNPAKPGVPCYRPQPQSLSIREQVRTKTANANANPGANPQPEQKDPASRASRIISRLPPSLVKYGERLRGAPVSHVVAFLLLHEFTAVIPLLGLFGVFHYTEYAPVGYVTEHYGGYLADGARRFERYFRRKGWLGFEEDANEGDGEDAEKREAGQGHLERWQTDGRYSVVVEIALAYAITKALLPVRIVASLWATPWFAGVLVRLRSLVTRKRS